MAQSGYVSSRIHPFVEKEFDIKSNRICGESNNILYEAVKTKLFLQRCFFVTTFNAIAASFEESIQLFSSWLLKPQKSSVLKTIPF